MLSPDIREILRTLCRYKKVEIAFAEQEGVFQVIHVGGNGVLCHAILSIEFLKRIDSVGDVGGIGQGTHRGAEQIDDAGETMRSTRLYTAVPSSGANSLSIRNSPRVYSVG